MTRATVTTDFFEALDVLFDDVPEFSFDTILLFNHVTETVGFFWRQVLGTSIWADGEFLENLLAGRKTDTVDVGQGDFDSFVVWNVDSRDTYHRDERLVFTEKIPLSPGAVCALDWCR